MNYIIVTANVRDIVKLGKNLPVPVDASAPSSANLHANCAILSNSVG